MLVAVALPLMVLVVWLVARDGESVQGPAGEPEELPPPETVRDCPSAVYGEGINPESLEDAVVAGPLTLVLEAWWADRPSRAFTPVRVLKVLMMVRAGDQVTLVVPEGERDRLSLLYDMSEPSPRRPLRLSDGAQPCPAE